jgi:hypothetical protein
MYYPHKMQQLAASYLLMRIDFRGVMGKRSVKAPVIFEQRGKEGKRLKDILL